MSDAKDFAQDLTLGTVDAFLGQSMSRENATTAWKRNRAAYKQRYRWTMNDMKKAGLNPMLAYRGTSGSFPTAPALSPHPAGISSSAQGFAMADKTNTEEKKMLQEIDESLSRQSKMLFEEQKISADTKKSLEEVELLMAKWVTEHLTQDQQVELIKRLRYQMLKIKNLSDVERGPVAPWLASAERIKQALGISVGDAMKESAK